LHPLVVNQAAPLLAENLPFFVPDETGKLVPARCAISRGDDVHFVNDLLLASLLE
jgi:hypothetical protein